MAAQIENVRAVSRDTAMPVESEEPKRRVSALDSEASMKRHRQLWTWMQEEKERQHNNRYQMALDEDFKDGLQWSPEEIQELEARFQAPLVFNLIHGAVKWVTGTEKRTRIDYKVLPREPGDIQGAHVKTQLMKYVSDVNHAPWYRSQAFEDAVTAGVGWVETGINSDPTQEPLRKGYEHWRNMWYDSLNRTLDEDRSRYLFRKRILDLDIASAMFPKRQSLLDRAAAKYSLFDAEDELYNPGDRTTSREEEGWVTSRFGYSTGFSFIDSARERLELVEAWYRMPVRMKVMVAQGEEMSLLHGLQFDPAEELHQYAKQQGAITLAETMRMQVRVAVMCEGGLLQDMPSPYRHGRFGLTPIWGYRRKRDGAPYGLVRLMRDPQSDLNKRRSKSLFLLSSRVVIADDGAYRDLEELREEAARPDAVLIKKPGKELRLEQHLDLAQAHHAMELQDAQYIHQTSGVTAENLGLDSNSQSGKAVLAKQQQGSLTTQDLFDNLRHAFQIDGENELSLIEQFYTQAKIIRIVGADGSDQHLTINQEQDDGSIKNDIVASKADFIVSAADYAETIRMALFEQLMQLLGRLPPEISLRLLTIALELLDLPMRDKMLAKIREITGEPDTNQPLTEEEAQRQQQRQQQMAKQAQLQEAMQQSQLEDVAAAADQKRAAAENLRAQAQATMAELQAEADGTGDDRVKELTKALGKIQEQLWDEKVRGAEKDVQLANREQEIASKERIAMMSKGLELASKDDQHEKSLAVQHHIAMKQHALQRDAQSEQGKRESDDKRYAVDKQAEVAREGQKTQSDTQKHIAKHKVASDEKVGMAGVKAKEKAAASKPGQKTAAQMGLSKPTGSPREPAAPAQQPVIGELHVHIPQSAMPQQQAAKPKAKRKPKKMTLKSGGKSMTIEMEGDDE